MNPKLKLYMVHKFGAPAGFTVLSDLREYRHASKPGWYVYQRQWIGPIQGYFIDEDKKMYENWAKDNLSGEFYIYNEYMYIASNNDAMLFRLTWIE